MVVVTTQIVPPILPDVMLIVNADYDGGEISFLSAWVGLLAGL